MRISAAQVDSAHAAWSERAQAQWQKYLAWEQDWLAANPDSTAARRARLSWTEGGALDSMRSWAQRHPMTVSTTFDNRHGPDFSALFEEAPVIEGTPADSARLRDYAMHLRDLIRSEDADSLYFEIGPSVSDSIGFYQVAPTKGKGAAIRYIRTRWIPNYTTDFTATDVVLRRWSNGRVWQLRRVGPNQRVKPFFHSPEGYLEVYVAEIKGSLKIVRLTA